MTAILQQTSSASCDLPAFLQQASSSRSSLDAPSAQSESTPLDRDRHTAGSASRAERPPSDEDKQDFSTFGVTMGLAPPSASATRSRLLVPPLNFQNVAQGVSRSGHPNERNYEFIRRMKLKTIMYLASDDYRPSISAFAQKEGIRVLHYRINVNKEPFAEMEEPEVAEALSQVLDRRNHPMLIHCNKGKYRVGCLIGILRRLQGWSYTSIFEEYARFAGTKALDEEFIEVFDLSKVRVDPEHKPAWL